MADVTSSTSDGATDQRHRVVIVKGDHRWIFRWGPGDEREVARRAMELARDRAVPFDLVDALTVTRQVLRHNGTIVVTPQDQRSDETNE